MYFTKEIDLAEFYGRPPAEAKGAEVIGASQIILMVGALALVIAMDIDTFYRSRHWIRRNWRAAGSRIMEQKNKIWKEEDPDDLNRF